MRRSYELLLHLYPAEYRRVFATEMLAVIEEAAEDHHPTRAIIETLALLRGAALEWTAKLEQGAHYLSEPPIVTELDEITKTRVLIQHNLRCMEHAIANHDFPKARFYSEEDRKEREKLTRLLENWSN